MKWNRAYGHLAGAVVIWFLAAAPVRAEAPNRAYLNGTELTFPVSAAVIEGRLFVPARAYLEAMGARVLWDYAAQRITAVTGDRVVELGIGDHQARVNGREITLDVAPLISAGYTLIPLRFLSEALGARVVYAAEDRRVDVAYAALVPVSRSGIVRPRSVQPVPGSAGTEPAAPSAPDSEVLHRLVVFDGPLNVRSGPGTEHQVLATLPTGTSMQLVQDDPDWVQVLLGDGRTGWVAGAFVRAADAAPRADAIFDRLLGVGKALLGRPYLWGGVTPAGFDCSGLLRYMFAQVGIALPRDTLEQAGAGSPVTGALLPGDILVFSTYAPGPSHTAMYIGQQEFLHAANERDGVTIDSLESPYWSSRYLAARRVLPAG